MSINTANLITTENGQAALAEVHEINARLFADHREISVEFLFPYIAISNKKPSEITEIESSSDADIRAELCYAPVDVCQVQTYAVEDNLKRDFTIGGLFEVKLDITDARTIILFCKTHIADNRSEGKKARDGHRNAADVLLQDYGYAAVQLPFAYTTVLDSTGTYDEENGLAIGASKYGRSRHRFYFNYIIDNNSGIADNITVDDNVYPYSDGYLSKTAFELGLKRYEQAIKDYWTDYKKYADGHSPYYKNMESAIALANPMHKFCLLENEAITDYSNVDIQAASDKTGWTNWPQPGTDETYKGFTPKEFVTFDNLFAFAVGRAIRFNVTDLRKIYITKNGVTKEEYKPVEFTFLLFVRTSLRQVCKNMPYVNVYNFIRIWVKIPDVANTGIELPPLETLPGEYAVWYAPQCPSIGKIEFAELEDGKKELKFSLLLETLRATLNGYDSSITAKQNVQFGGCVMKYGSDGVIEESSFSPFGKQELTGFIKFYEQSGSPTGDFPGLYFATQPNFAGGYCTGFYHEATQSAFAYIIPKEFDAWKTENGLPYNAGGNGVMGSEEFCCVQSSINKDIITYKTLGNSETMPYKGGLVIFKEGKLVNVGNYDEDPRIETGTEPYRVIGDFKLHNARVYLLDDAYKNSSDLYPGDNGYDYTEPYNHPDSSTAFVVIVYAENKQVSLVTDYEDFFDGIEFPFDYLAIEKLVVTDVELSQDDKITLSLQMHLNIESDRWLQLTYKKSLAPSNCIKRYVAIEDVNGDTNIIRETIC